MRKIVLVLVIVLLVVLLPVFGLALLSLFSPGPRHLGVTDGRLADCPASPNCVCTHGDDAHRMEPIPFDGSAVAALARLQDVVADMPGGRVVTAEGNYLHAEFTSALFRFVDDVEFLIDPERQVIHFRSASRAGHSDLGVNRRRMETIRARFE